MPISYSSEHPSVSRRIGYCLLPFLLGMGAALVLLLAAGGPARPAFASDLTYPGVCGATIQQCIDNANTGDTILISAGDYTESLTLSKAVSLTGALSSTTILHALPNTRVLTVTGALVNSSVVISGLTFTGGVVTGTVSCPASCGGGILITETAQPVLTNLQLIGNFAQLNGGGLYAAGDVTVIGSSFVSNTAASPGNAFINIGGGGLFAAGAVTLTNSSFVNNQATEGFGGGADAGSAWITGTVFEANSAGKVSGGLYTTNAATLAGTTFTHNVAGSSGGGLEAFGPIVGIACQFVDNTAASPFGGQGGGLVSVMSVILTDTNFIHNTAFTLGGGLVAIGSITVTGGSFISNSTQVAYIPFDGGGGLAIRGPALLTGTQILSNSSAFIGGGLYFNSNTFTDPSQRRLVNSLVAGNHATSQGDGLFVDLGSGSLAVLHNTFGNPSLVTGTAIYVNRGAVGITNSIFASNTVAINLVGGSVYQDYNLFFSNGANGAGPVSGGSHSLGGNPRFVSPAGNDYHLRSGSPAVDSGINAGVTTDFDGDPRPLGTGFDIGFDESPFTASADVGVVKSVSAAVRQPGQTLSYTLAFSNAGPGVAAGVRLTDLVPSNLTAVTYTSSGAALTLVGGPAFAWQVANLAPGAGGIVTITGVVNGALAGTVFTNTATITTTAVDANPANNASAVSVTVGNVAPLAASDAYALPPNTSLTVPAPGLLANDTDSNHDPLTAQLVTSPTVGTLVLAPSGAFTYTPPLNFTGPITFTYRASDGLLLSPAATVTITVNAFKLFLPLLRR